MQNVPGKVTDIPGENDGKTVPNWLKELEAKRESRLRAQLGHETGAGSACLHCKEKCPGLDLHFWRKICKNCKCTKEQHDVQDDDGHGWVQFHLLGSKNQGRKVRLSGKAEMDLEWIPKGSAEAVEKYLKTLPDDRLPIKGSTAAQERKQLLQKQIPIHDMDPSLCHALSEEETSKMRDYVDHLKQTSVGVGQLVNFARKKHDYENIDDFGNHKLAVSLEEIQRQQQLLECDELLDSYGNPLRAQFAILLDANMLPLKDQNDKPVKASLDLLGQPIFDRVLSEKLPLQKSKFAMLLDKNGAPILDPLGNPLKNRISIPAETKMRYKYAQLLDGSLNRLATVPLDVFERPIISKNLSEVYPRAQWMSFLDANGATVKAADGTELIKPLAPSAVPTFAVLLDENKKPIQDMANEPLVVQLDALKTPILNDAKCTVFEGCKPQYAVLLDAQSKAMALQKLNFKAAPANAQSGILLDEMESPMKDLKGLPLKVQLDRYKRPKYDAATVEKLQGRRPEYLMLLDANGAPILDKYACPVKAFAFDQSEPLEAPQTVYLLDRNKKPLKDNCGQMLRGDLDILGRLLSTSAEDDCNAAAAEYVMKMDQYGQPIKGLISPVTYLQVPTVVRSESLPRVSNNGNPLESGFEQLSLGPQAPAVVLDKYGYQLDPSTGRPISTSLQIQKQPVEKCHKCARNIENNDLVVCIDRRANALWHNECFQCAKCHENLVDLLYFYHQESDDIYCGRDIARIRGIPRCHACDELIFVKEYCLAEENTYHVKHFCCYECDLPLAGGEYVMADANQPVCIPCYEQVKADRCRSCLQVISAHEKGANLNGEHFHADDRCFSCRNCRQPLLGAKFLYRNGRLFCSAACFQQDNQKCH